MTSKLMTIGNDWTVKIETVEIIEGVKVVIFDNSEAVLRLNGADAVTFNWTHEASEMFADIDVCEVIELLELLQRTQIR